MKEQKIKTSEQIARKRNFTLLELLDRLLDKGVVVKGEILLSVADIDLVYLNLGLLLSSVKTIEEAASRGDNGEAKSFSWQTSTPLQYPQVDRESMLAPAVSLEEKYTHEKVEMRPRELLDEPLLDGRIPFPKENSQRNRGNEELQARGLPGIMEDGMDQHSRSKTNIDPKNVEKGLAKLVLTLVDLIRKLMEKQAIRRVEAGQLNFEEIEKVGDTFLLLDEKIEQLKKVFGLKDEDLNLDLGPLGELL